MKNSTTLLCACLFVLNAFAQNKTIVPAEQQILKAIAGKVSSVKPDMDATVLHVPLETLTEDCVDVVYFKDTPKHAGFFSLTDTKVDFKRTFATYDVSVTGTSQLIEIRLLLVEFPKGTDMNKTSFLLAPCYCVPMAYVIPFYTPDGLFVSFEPQIGHIEDTQKRVELFKALKNYLIKNLSPKYTYQNVSLLNND